MGGSLAHRMYWPLASVLFREQILMASPNIISIGGDGSDELSLLDILDHVLNSGVVIQGSIVISIGGVDLIYVGLNVVLTSVETALRTIEADQNKSLGPGK